MRIGKTFIVFSFAFLLFFSGCGLEEYVYIVGPRILNHTSNYETAADERYVEFTTEETANAGKTQFQGTAIYYKIYNNHSDMSSQYSSITSLSSSTNESAAATRMIDSYKYKQLGLSDNYDSPLIENAGVNRRIYIRITNYYDKTSNSNKALLIVGDSDVNKFRNNPEDVYDSATNPGGYRIRGTPRRVGNKYSFDFGRAKSPYENAEYNKTPSSDDNMDDFKESSSFSESKDGVYYVDLFAVGVGEDENFTRYYSNVLHLGSVAVDSNSEYN